MTRTILVVDDEHDLAATCQRFLSRRGWNVVIAGSREAALAALRRSPRPTLAIVDRQLPDGDGLDVLRAAVALSTPTILVTGYGSAATRQLALDEGAAGFLAKPYSMHDLLELIRRTVGDGPRTVMPTDLPPPGERPRPGIRC
jgi:DNA-binding response OmpR family regulator